MGKDIKGKDLGKGITQNKTNKLFYARFTSIRTHRTVEEHFKNVKDAQTWYAKAVKADKQGVVLKSPNMTVDEFFEYWKEDYRSGKALNTQVSDKNRYEQNVQPVIGSMRMCMVERHHCVKILNDMIYDYKKETIRRVYNFLTRFFDDAVYENVIDCSPVRVRPDDVPGSKKISKSRERATDYTPQQMDKLVEVIKGSRTKYKIQYLLLLETGMRIGELCGLRIKDVDFENRVIHIRQQYVYVNGKWTATNTKHYNLTKNSRANKSPKFEDIYMTDLTYQLLKKAVENRKMIKSADKQFEDLLFLSRNGKPITNSAYWKRLTAIIERNNLKHISVHSLRHFFGTEVDIANCGDTKGTQACMRHEHYATTYDIYVSKLEKQKYDSMEKLQEYRVSRGRVLEEIV